MSDDTRSVAPVVSLGLAVLTVALVVVGLPVVVAPARTDRYFAWTINVPLTAAFLGACYWSAALFTLLSARERKWPHVRLVMPGILVALPAAALLLAGAALFAFPRTTGEWWLWPVTELTARMVGAWLAAIGAT